MNCERGRSWSGSYDFATNKPLLLNENPKNKTLVLIWPK